MRPPALPPVPVTSVEASPPPPWGRLSSLPELGAGRVAGGLLAGAEAAWSSTHAQQPALSQPGPPPL